MSDNKNQAALDMANEELEQANINLNGASAPDKTPDLDSK